MAKRMTKRKPSDPVQLNIQVRWQLRVAAAFAAKRRHVSLNQFVTDAIEDAVRANSPAIKNMLWDRLSDQAKALIVEDMGKREAS